MAEEEAAKQNDEEMANDEQVAMGEEDNTQEEQNAATQAEPDDQMVSVDGGDSEVRSAEFERVNQSGDGVTGGGVDLILDVQMRVSVELGRTVMQVRDVLALGPGAVVELEKAMGDPVEVVVNNKTVARGEVVVIDENFGVRITEILNARGSENSAIAA